MNFIPVNEPLLDGNEKQYLCECIDTGWISSEGPFVKRFEQDMAAYVGRKYGIAVSNGTAALEAAMQALNLEKGSEVILPTFTIMSCAQAITKCGLVPVVVDCKPDTWNMDVDAIEEKITSKTRAIMVVHIYGLPVEMDKVLALAKKYDLKIIEDAAEMHGQTYKGKMCGSFGDISIFSFYSNKHIACGEGGMILTDNEQLAERSRGVRNLFFMPERRYVHEEIGSNFRMTNMQAALGCAQLEKIDAHLKRKREIGKYYQDALQDIADIELPVAKTDYTDNIYWVFGIVLGESYKFDAAEACGKLKEMGIGTRTFFYPMHKQPVFMKQGMFQNVVCPNAEKIAKRGFYIPCGLGITDEQMERVAACLHELLKN
jgi:perosamine synthetase